MDKNKSMFFTVMIIFCVVLSGIGGFFLGTKFGGKNQTIVEECQQAKINIEDYGEYTLEILYNFIESKNNDLKDYLTNLNNSQKLYAAGILDGDIDGSHKNKKFSDLKENLISIYGSDLNVLPNDYYPTKFDEEPLYKYNKETDEYIYNELFPPGDVLTDLDVSYIYNYKLESTKEKDNILTITYYGLYADGFETGPTEVTNLNNISRTLNQDIEFGAMSDEEYLKQAFMNNKDDFFKFMYSYKKINNKYILIDFKQA